ncbi:MAG: hypothetical protein GC150_14560 [Rhizobiales bacterium]|nr:hypothetical protein [Hyphomicrobiales bacterium]
MAYTERTSRSWFSRLGGAFSGMAIGLVLLIASLIGLFWNEGRAINTHRALEEGAGVVLEIDAARLDPTLEGRLVHIAGPLVLGADPEDRRLAITAPGAVRLERVVEMYQWQEVRSSETRTKLGGGEETVTTYRYELTWSDRPIASSGFKVPAGHENPTFPIEGEVFPTTDARIGAFALPAREAAGLGSSTALPLDQAAVDRITTRLSYSRPSHLVDGVVLMTRDPKTPVVGDLRISYRHSIVADASGVGAQRSGALTPYTTSNGRTILLLKSGIMTAANMFADAIAGNNALTWVLRVVGLIALFFGFILLLRVLGVLGDVVPLVGRIIRAGTGVIALVLTLLLGSLTIALGWLAYRPLIGLSVLAAGVALAVVVFGVGRRRADEPAAGRRSPHVGPAR